jgi:hypothetical protein
VAYTFDCNFTFNLYFLKLLINSCKIGGFFISDDKSIIFMVLTLVIKCKVIVVVPLAIFIVVTYEIRVFFEGAKKEVFSSILKFENVNT